MLKSKNTIKNKGFTLIEVLASIVLLSILILTFSNSFVFSNRTAVSNNDNLAAVNLAKATLEKIKNDPYMYINDPKTGNIDYENNPITFNINNCPINNRPCQNLFSVTINNKTYNISITASQNAAKGDKNLNLINVLVQVNSVNSTPIISSKIEGYISNE
jgi:prepilin-type N-terminal cleavage/methylation domain-containing protein